MSPQAPGRPCLGCGRLIRHGSRCHECRIPRPENTAGWRATRRAILARDGYLCARCGAYADTVDHRYPLSLGGSSHDANLIALCQHCNASKRDGAR